MKKVKLIGIAVGDDKSPEVLIAKQVGTGQFEQQRYKPRLWKLQIARGTTSFGCRDDRFD